MIIYSNNLWLRLALFSPTAIVIRMKSESSHAWDEREKLNQANERKLLQLNATLLLGIRFDECIDTLQVNTSFISFCNFASNTASMKMSLIYPIEWSLTIPKMQLLAIFTKVDNVQFIPCCIIYYQKYAQFVIFDIILSWISRDIT